jgi:hypothetical protein
MAATTTPRRKPRTAATPKPKTTRSWLDKKFAPKKYRTSLGAVFGNAYKGLRALDRAGKRQAERARERKLARTELREPATPSWNDRRKQRRETERGPRNKCLACGESVAKDQVADHPLTCKAPNAPAAPGAASTAPKPKRAKAKAAATPVPAAQAAPTVAPAPVAPGTPGTALTPEQRAASEAQVRDWKRTRAADRKANMTRTARTWDVTRRAGARAIGRGGKCASCGMNLTFGEMDDHDCGGNYIPVQDYYGVPDPAAPTTTPTTATPTPTATSPPAAPATGPNPAAPGKTNGREAPVALLGRNQSQGSSNGSTQTGGSGNSSAYAQQIMQVMTAWSQDTPKTLTELGANMQAMSAMCIAMSQSVQEFQGRMINMPPGPDGTPRGFHPSTVAPLNGPSQRFAEASAGFVETFVAVTRYYQVLIDMHQSGTPVPDAAFLRG